MKGSLVKRGVNRWAIVVDRGYVVGPDGKRRRKQQWVSFRGNKQQADARLNELVGTAHRGEFVAPSKLTFGDWLDAWLEKAIKPKKRSRTYVTYEGAIRKHLKPALGALRIQDLQALDIE